MERIKRPDLIPQKMNERSEHKKGQEIYSPGLLSVSRDQRSSAIQSKQYHFFFGVVSRHFFFARTLWDLVTETTAFRPYLAQEVRITIAVKNELVFGGRPRLTNSR